MKAQAAMLRVSGIRAYGYRHVLARFGLLGSLVLVGGMFIGGIFVIVPELRTRCTGAGCYSWQVNTHTLISDAQLNAFSLYQIGLNALILGGFCLVAIVIAVRRSDEPFALFVAFALITFGASLIDVIRALAVSSPIAYWPREFVAFLGWSSLLVSFYLFPTGRFEPRWTRFASGAWVIFIALHYVTPPAWGMSPKSPAESGIGGDGQSVFGFGLILFLLSVVVAQVHRYRRISTPEQRQQTKWVVVGFVTSIGGFIAYSGWGSYVFGNEDDLSGRVLSLLVFDLLLLLLPLALALAILRYRLWDIDLIINRALVYGMLTACVVGLYVLVVGYLGTVFRTGGSLLFSLVATGIVAVLFQPLRERVQRGVNRLMYGEQDEPYAVLSRLGQRLGSTLAIYEVLPTVVQTVAQSLKLPYVGIALEQDGEFTQVASFGVPTEQVTTFPLHYRGEVVGQLLAAPRPGERGFSAADRRLLDDLAGHAGAPAQNLRLTAELQRSRERLVSLREEERRRIRRDLHDGLGPALASAMLKINSARRLLAPSSPAEPVLLEVREAIQASITDIRRLVYDLRPPALDQLGLLDAIREIAFEFEAADLRISFQAPARLPPLPAAVEVAAYRIIQEALTNVVRHAQAHSCHVRLAAAEGLELDVRDDGVGMGDPRERTIGVGLTSMRDRAAELGGRCVIESIPEGGTRVRAFLPLSHSRGA